MIFNVVDQNKYKEVLDLTCKEARHQLLSSSAY